MKKLLSLLLIITSVFTIFSGCESNVASIDIAKNLNTNLNKLTNIVKKLDTLDTNYIYNPDIISSNQLSLPANNEAKHYALAFNENDTSTDELIKNLIIQNLQEKYLNNNGYCANCNQPYNCDENGYCNSCNYGIVCDENGNCYNCHNEISLDNNFNCSSCNKTALVSKYNDANNENEYSVEQLSTDVKIDEITDGETTNLNAENILSTETTQTDTAIIENNNDTEQSILENNNFTETEESEITLDTREDNKSNTKFYFYTRESFEPIKLKYKPRYINEFNETNINEQLVNYLYKIQKLYAMTEDAIEANNILNNCKFTLIDCVKEVKDLNKDIINGKCEPTSQQLQALQNYTQDLKNTIKNLKACNGDLTDEVNNISNNTPTSLATSVDVLNSNYLRLINHIDTRITYHESALATLEQLKYLLNEAVGEQTISEEEINEIVEELTNNEEIVIEAENNSEVINDNNIETPTIHANDAIAENAEDTDEVTANDKILNEDNIETDSYNNNEDNELNNTNETIVTESNEEVVLENNNENSEIEVVERNDSTISNIDTYMNDTFENGDIEENKNIAELDENNTIVDENPIDNNVNSSVNDNNDTLVDKNNVLPNQNNINTNTNNNSINTHTYQNSTGFTNSVITQNNLNNNDGYGGYYYGTDGEIRNNGVNNNNSIGNDGNTIENNLNNNNNVNTYGYNTMLDILNQGTVNNGINTLSVKPSYVVNDSEIVNY